MLHCCAIMGRYSIHWHGWWWYSRGPAAALFGKLSPPVLPKLLSSRVSGLRHSSSGCSKTQAIHTFLHRQMSLAMPSIALRFFSALRDAQRSATPSDGRHRPWQQQRTWRPSGAHVCGP